MQFIDGEADISEIMRYILNKTNNIENIIIDGPFNRKLTNDYVKQYEIYNRNSFENISQCIYSMFKKNGISLENHFEKNINKERK